MNGKYPTCSGLYREAIYISIRVNGNMRIARTYMQIHNSKETELRQIPPRCTQPLLCCVLYSTHVIESKLSAATGPILQGLGFRV